jgi:hypothetical protein
MANGVVLGIALVSCSRKGCGLISMRDVRQYTTGPSVPSSTRLGGLTQFTTVYSAVVVLGADS